MFEKTTDQFLYLLFCLCSLVVQQATSHSCSLRNLPNETHGCFDNQWRTIEERALGGDFGGKGEFASHVSLIKSTPSGESYCGAVLISEDAVLTAAHCVVGWPQNGLQVKLNGIYFEEGPSVKVRRVCKHPNYLMGTQYDLAVSLLERSVHTKPAALLCDNCEQDMKKFPARAVGFGLLESNIHNKRTKSNRLKWIEMKKKENAFCAHRLHNSMVCYVSSTSGEPCTGDIGGPLYVQIGRKQILIALTGAGPSSRSSSLKIGSIYTDLYNKKRMIDDLIKSCRV